MKQKMNFTRTQTNKIARNILSLVILIITGGLCTSCDDTTENIGMSLTDGTNNISAIADTFFVESRSVRAANIVSRSGTSYLGRIKDPETQSTVTCNYMMQFTTGGTAQFPELSEIVLNANGEIEADSCELILYFDKYYGDTLAQMKAVAHELAIPYEEGQIYPTTFNPKENGMIRSGEGSIHSELAYTISNRRYSNSDRLNTAYVPNISFPLNNEYVSALGQRFNNYGTYIMKRFYDEQYKGCFSNSYKFNHEICPGFYIETIGGLGSLGSITMACLVIHFQIKDSETTKKVYSLFSSTEEVLSKTTIIQDDEKLDVLTSDSECTYLKTPAGIFTEMTLPIAKIMQGRIGETEDHVNDSLSTVRMFVPRSNNEVTTDYSLSVPSNLLLLPVDSVESFFENRKVANSKTSYVATFSSSTNGYTFNNLSALVALSYKELATEINSAIEEKKKELSVQQLSTSEKQRIEQQVTANYSQSHPNWNKVMLIPVETTYSTLSSTSSVLTKVTHDMSLSSTRLIKGSATNDNIVVNVVYSKFSK